MIATSVFNITKLPVKSGMSNLTPATIATKAMPPKKDLIAWQAFTQKSHMAHTCKPPHFHIKGPPAVSS